MIMKTGNGIVKKYSREYKRTLKSGEQKKYTTQQIQITIPKNEDIYQDKEEVLIIPNNEIENFKGLEEEIEFLKVANYFYVEEVEELQKKIDENLDFTSEYKKEIEKLKNEIKLMKEELTKLKETSNIDMWKDDLKLLKKALIK